MLHLFTKLWFPFCVSCVYISNFAYSSMMKGLVRKLNTGLICVLSKNLISKSLQSCQAIQRGVIDTYSFCKFLLKTGNDEKELSDSIGDHPQLWFYFEDPYWSNHFVWQFSLFPWSLKLQSLILYVSSLRQAKSAKPWSSLISLQSSPLHFKCWHIPQGRVWSLFRILFWLTFVYMRAS